MSESQVNPAEMLRASTLIREWQTRMVDLASRALFWVLTAGTLLLFVDESRLGWKLTPFVALMAVTMGAIAFVWRGRAEHRALALFGVCTLTMTWLVATRGFLTPNPFSGLVLISALAGLLLPRRHAVGVLLLLSVSLLVVAWHCIHHPPDIHPTLLDLTSTSNWARVLLIAVMLGGATLWGVSFMMARLRTALHRREQLFRALQTESTDRIARLERQRELEHQLRHSQKLEALGELAGGVAHDFNNLLLVMIASAEMARHASSDEERNEGVDEVLAAADKAAALTRRLLTFSRKPVLQRTVVDMNKTVAESMQLIQRLLPSNIEHDFEPGAGVGRFLGSADELDQVLINLCVNARDAMPKGGKLHVSTHCVRGELAENDELSLVVRDTGIGLSEEMRRKVFEPFFTSKGPGRGTGLGLSIVQNIATQQGGRVEVTSDEGKGAEFRVVFRRGLLPKLTSVLSKSGSYAGRGELLLVIDDDAGVRRSLARTLRSGGYEVVEASGGEQGLRQLSQLGEQVSLVITDMVMPGLSGREVHDHVLVMNPRLPLLVCSGYAAGTLDSDFLDLPNRSYLAKPFHAAELLQVVRAMLDSAQASSSLPEMARHAVSKGLHHEH